MRSTIPTCNYEFSLLQLSQLKKNHLMVQKLINDFDSIFLIEHWLTNDEKYLISDLINDHSMIFESDMHDFSNKRKPGRPFGGRCWLIKNSVKALAVEQFNKIVSMIKIRRPSKPHWPCLSHTSDMRWIRTT
jgi:hypothetical protein